MFQAFPNARSSYSPPRPTHAVKTLETTLHDAARNRDVPIKVYYPTDTAGPSPVILFSHGLGGSREGYRYLGEHWAACGYVSVHMQHLGSDEALWRNADAIAALTRAATDPRNAINRCADVTFTIDQLTLLNGAPTHPLHARLDLTRIGAAGHSFGGHTTMAVAGEAAILPSRTITMRDQRVQAAIAMSAPLPLDPRDYPAAFAPITIPVFILTARNDNSPIGPTAAADRRVAFDHLKNAPAYFLSFTEGDHMLFSHRANDLHRHALIQQSTTAFWDAFLRNLKDARAWFDTGGLKAAVADAAKVEIRP